MTCDLSDPQLKTAYEQIINDGGISWLSAGYKETRDVISLYKTGSEGFNEMRQFALGSDEVLFLFFRLESRYIFVSYISERATGVKRARALVHGRVVANLFKSHQLQLTLTSPNELTDSHIRSKMRLHDSMGSLDRLSTSADRLSSDASAIIGRRSETPSVSGTSTSAPRRQSSNQVSGGGENGTSSPGRRRSEMLRESLSTPTSTGLTHSTSNASNIAEGSGNSGVLPRRRSTVTEEGAPAVKQQQLPPQLEDYNVHAVRPQSILSTVSSSSPQPVANIRSTESTLLNPTRSQYEPKRPSVSQKPTSPPPPVRHGSIAVELLQQQQQQQQQDWEELVPNGLDIGYITELGDHFNWRRRLFRVRNRALQLYSLDPRPKLIKQLEFESISAVDSNAQTEIVVKNSVQLLLKSGTQADRLFGGRPVYFFADSVRDLQTFINQLGY